MTDFDPPVNAVRELVRVALAEDLGLLGDLTSVAVVAPDAIGTATFRSRTTGVLAGTLTAGEVCTQVDPTLACTWLLADGADLAPGVAFGTLQGRVRSILAAERTALNVLGHCSGIATRTREYVRAAGGRTRIRDTRKTLPGLRAIEKAAVRAGGGFNHRESLSDAVLIKDNHLVGLDLAEAVQRARARWPGRVIEVECDTLEQVAQAKSVAPDLVLLDNMTPAQVGEAIAVLGGSVPVEVSGGVTLESVTAYADAGADFVSVGALTHSAPNLDLGLDR